MLRWLWRGLGVLVVAAVVSLWAERAEREECLELGLDCPVGRIERTREESTVLAGQLLETGQQRGRWLWEHIRSGAQMLTHSLQKWTQGSSGMDADKDTRAH